jgi:predicted O-linked N-acetylglucosamine transferase (SPINDLY family)
MTQVQDLFVEAIRQEQGGDFRRAEALCRAVLKTEPSHAGANNLLGILAARRGDFTSAVAALRQAIAVDERNADYRYNLGKAHELSDEVDLAIAAYRETIRVRPEHAEAWNNLGNQLRARNELAEAATCYRRVIDLGKTDAGTYTNLGWALRRQGDLEGAFMCYQKALELEPRVATTYNSLGIVLREVEEHEQALRCFRKALELDPDFTDAWSNLGGMLKDLGDVDAAIRAYQRALELIPSSAKTHGNILLCMNYSPRYTPAQLFEAHCEWAVRHEVPLATEVRPHTNEPAPYRRLKVGYVSADFRGHAAAQFLESFMPKHDHGQFEITCYSNVTVPDQLTERFQTWSDRWRVISGMEDAQVADLIRRDEIDILVDLSGHTGGNRLLVFARKPAPIQVTYMGYMNTTGMHSMDYRLSDNHADPANLADRYHAEKVVRLSGTAFCYRPPENSPEVGPLPYAATSRITFCSFNNLAKIGPDVISLWAKILLALPGSRLVMVTKGAHRMLQRAFEHHGIDPGRIEFLRRLGFDDYLRLHEQVDIALDPFPYNGGATTCHALWLGVPVVSLAGKTSAARMGASILDSLDLSDLVAETAEQYLHIVIGLANQPARLEELRRGLRQRMVQSPLTDALAFTRNLETVYRELWGRWCESRVHDQSI